MDVVAYIPVILALRGGGISQSLRPAELWSEFNVKAILDYTSRNFSPGKIYLKSTHTIRWTFYYPGQFVYSAYVRSIFYFLEMSCTLSQYEKKSDTE